MTEVETKIAAYRYSGPHGAECVIDEGATAWFGYAAVTLDGGEYALGHGKAPASPSLADAAIDACEGLIAWCSEQKEKGSKRNRKEAEEVQNWALDLVSKMRQEREAAQGTPTEVTAPVTPEASIGQIQVERLSGPEVLHARTTDSIAPQMYPLDQLFESPLNPRQYISVESIERLAASIKQSGFWPSQPIVGRPRTEGGAEIAAGHRRRLAAIRAGLREVPCIIRPMADKEFEAILNFDNSGREDVHPLDEAAGWRGMMERHGMTVLDIAARIGRSKEYVYQRLKYGDLIQDAKQAFIDGDINQTHAILIARLAPADQQKALRACQPPAFDPEKTVSSRDLDNWIKRNLHIDLNDAPFSLDAAELLPAAGACAACPHRLGNAPDFDAAVDLPNTCNRPSCYDEKLEAHMTAETARVQSLGGVLISEGSTTRRAGVLPFGTWHRATEDTPGAKPALIVEGMNRGESIFVVLQETLPIQQPAQPAPKPKKQAAPKRSADEIAREQEERERFIEQQKRDEERRQAEEQKRQRQIALEKTIRQNIAKAIFAKAAWPPKREDVLRLLDESELPESLDDLLTAVGVDPHAWTRASMEKLSPANLARLVVLIAIADDFDEWTFSRGCDQLMAAAKRYGVNAAKIRKDAEEAAKEAEGGTRKEVIGKLPTAGGQEKAKAPKGKPAPPAAAKKSAPKKQAAKKGGKK